MKCVTKLSHRGSGGKMEGDGEEAAMMPDDDDALGGGKRKRDDIEPVLESHGQQLHEMQQLNLQILEQLRNIRQTLATSS